MSSRHRSVAFDEHGRECADCGCVESLHIHHKDRDRSNNDPENLVVLCEEHHWDRHREEVAERASGGQGNRTTYGETEAFREKLSKIHSKGPDPTPAGPLRDADWAIIGVLREGRANAPLIAEQTGYSAQYVRERLGRMKQDDIVEPLGHGMYDVVPEEVPEENHAG